MDVQFRHIGWIDIPGVIVFACPNIVLEIMPRAIEEMTKDTNAL
jgi:hypothetical protein